MIIGSGVDIIEVERVRKAIKKWGDSFLRRVFTDEELSYAKNRRFPYEHLAARFAAKEAVLKAFSNQKMDFKDIKILNNGDGKPICELKDKRDNIQILLSISHTKDYAVANAIITKKS
ncbi:MAG: holo-ACP synthase [Candidatus Omnitrophota bacterium]